jgi:hypothetical protein
MMGVSVYYFTFHNSFTTHTLYWVAITGWVTFLTILYFSKSSIEWYVKPECEHEWYETHNFYIKCKKCNKLHE